MRTLNTDIERMIHLRTVDELSYSAIGRELGKDHTTIMYHCKRLGVQSPAFVKVSQRTGERSVIRVIKAIRVAPIERIPHKYEHILEENINRGKSYRDYLKDALARPVEKRYYKTYYQTPLTPDEARRIRNYGALA